LIVAIAVGKEKWHNRHYDGRYRHSLRFWKEPMKKVTILAPYNTMATTIFGPMDIFNQAGRLWNRVTKSPQTPFFDVTIIRQTDNPSDP
jgi:hypothetical protein